METGAEAMEIWVSEANGKFDDLIQKTDRHERELKELKDNQRLFITNFEAVNATLRTMQETNERNTKDTSRQLSQMDVRVDVVSKDVKEMSTEMNKNNGIFVATMNQQLAQGDKLIELARTNGQTAATVQTTKMTTDSDRKKVVIPAVLTGIISLILGLMPFVQDFFKFLFKL